MLIVFVNDLCNHHLHVCELAIMLSLIINDTEMLFRALTFLQPKLIYDEAALILLTINE